MAAMNIFDYYGIKEVANVYFEALSKDGAIEPGDIVLYLDTLKVSTVETTAENVSAQGGWGNPKLITWDYGKDINITLEDAVVSFEELRIMLGAKLKEATTDNKVTVRMSADFRVVEEDGTKSLVCTKLDGNDKAIVPSIKANTNVRYIDRVHGTRGQATSVAEVLTKNTALAANDHVMLFWEEERAGGEGNEAVELVISPDTYPGTYRVVGDALIRNKDGKDEAFQFVINKAKMLSEVTLTMQAEGDPSTFNMTLNVLRDDEGNMMSLIKY